MQQRVLSVPGYLAPGLVAGLAGGILIDAFLIAVVVFGTHAVTLEAFYQNVASGAVGHVAFSSGTYAWVGLALHLLISASWGAGYAYVANRTPQVAARPLVSGLVFGFVVYFAMQLVEVAAAMYRLPTPSSLGIALFAHCVCFGLPIAYALRALTARART